MKTKTARITTFATLLIAGMNAHSQTVAQWDFNAATDKLQASTGTGIADSLVVGYAFASDTASGGSTDPNAVGTGNGGGAWNLTSVNPAVWPAQGEASGTAGAQFGASTAGFNDPALTGLLVTFDLRTSNTASRWFRLDYTVNGTDWIPGTPVRLGDTANAGDTWHNNNSVAIDDLLALDNSDFAFRVLSVFSPVAFTAANLSQDFLANEAYEVARNTTSNYGGGTWRFDMVTVTAVPEPQTYAAIIGLLALGAVILRRRNR